MLITYGQITHVDAGLLVDLVMLDFSKAFDVVNHSVLLRQLLALGISRILVSWIESFLVGRTMQVSCGSSLSSIRNVASGVPQGSVLGPLLFLIYVNSLSDGLAAECMTFADEFKLFLYSSRKNDDAVLNHMVTLQRDIDRLSSTAASWNLRLSSDKCVVLRLCRGKLQALEQFRYVLDGAPLKFVNEHKDLGVTIDIKLRFHSHIHNIV